MELNKVIVAGRLTADPEYKTLPGGSNLTTFTIAMNRRWKNDAGETQEEVCFMGVKVFGKRAGVIRDYFKKGSNILVDGHLRQENWEKDGEKRSKHVVMLDNFSFVDPPKSKGDKGNGGPAPDAGADDGSQVPF